MRITMLIMLVLLVSTLFANPMMFHPVQQFWFNTEGELMLQFGEQAQSSQENTFQFYDGANTYSYYAYFPDYAMLPCTINAPYYMPGFAPNPAGGYFNISMNNMVIDDVHWGNDLSNEISALTGTQSAVHIWLTDPNDPESYTVDTWAKATHPDNVLHYNPDARSTIVVNCNDLEGNPLPEVPVYYRDFYFPYGYSSVDGIYSGEVYCTKTRIRVFQPNTGNTDVAVDSTFFAEPGQTYTFTAVLNSSAAEDMVAAYPTGKLILNPSVCKSGDALQISFDKTVSDTAMLELYDIKGRKLSTHRYDPQSSWTPPALASGMYFLRMVAQNHTLGTAKLIILK